MFKQESAICPSERKTIVIYVHLREKLLRERIEREFHKWTHPRVAFRGVSICEIPSQEFLMIVFLSDGHSPLDTEDRT